MRFRYFALWAHYFSNFAFRTQWFVMRKNIIVKLPFLFSLCSYFKYIRPHIIHPIYLFALYQILSAFPYYTTFHRKNQSERCHIVNINALFAYDNITNPMKFESPNRTNLLVGICVIYMLVCFFDCDTAAHGNHTNGAAYNTSDNKPNHHATSKSLADGYSPMTAFLHRLIS